MARVDLEQIPKKATSLYMATFYRFLLGFIVCKMIRFKFYYFTHNKSKKKSVKYNHIEAGSFFGNLFQVYPGHMSSLSSVKISASYVAPVRLANV